MRNSSERIYNIESITQEVEDPREERSRILAEEVVSLRAKASTKEDWDLITSKYKQIEKLSEVKLGNSVEMEKAMEVLGEDFLGPEAIKNAFGIEVAEKDIPEMPYSIEDLEKAKELGEMLVMRVAIDSEGRPMTMERISEIVIPTMTEEDGKLLFNDWFLTEKFYKTESVKTEWKLVSKEVVSDTLDKDYIEQTRILRDHLAKLGSLTDEELKNCSDVNLDKIREFMETDYDKNWPEAAKQLQELLVNQNHRRTATEALYDWVLKFKLAGERLLESEYDWTKSRSAGGGLVGFGGADAGGAGVGGGEPGGSDTEIGVVSSR